MEKIKFYGIDILKTIAILSVLSVHFLLNTEFYNSPIIGTSLSFQVFYRQLFIICVPLFLFVTGFLNWRKISFDKKYLVGIYVVLGTYFIYSILSIILRIFLFDENKSVLEWIHSIFTFSSNGYSWYVEMYIGLVLLIPFFNRVAQSISTKKEFQLFLLALLLLTAIPNFWNNFSNDIPILSAIEFPTFWVEFYPITYYFIGVYLRRFSINISSVNAFILFCILTFLNGLFVYLNNSGNEFSSNVGGYASLLVTLQSVALFISIYKATIPQTTFGKFISYPIVSISSLTLDIYLASFITDKVIYSYFTENYFTTQKYAILYAPIIIFSSFILAYLISLLRNKFIPLKLLKK
ncbi:acyltransferase [Ureibacillus sp. 179-F W5.1 NHS]|uniref:acyltransferase n=1 Tax=Ureibacillus sp. 179-F W5.1 NHS TaxID=3374297 RepID=UPI00387A500E